MALTYIYGVVAADAAVPREPGIGGTAVRLVPGDGLAALAGTIPDGEELTMGRRAMTAHARVLEAAHELGTVLPMRFGVVMEDDTEAAQRLLDAHRDDLLAQLEEFAGKAELKLRASYEEQTVMREIVREHREIARLRAELQGKSAEASYYAQIRLGELVAAALERKRETDAEAIMARLAPLALATELGTPPHERIALTASFLVQRSAVADFDAAVDRIGGEQEGRMRFRYTGPLPPHSFVVLAAEA